MKTTQNPTHNQTHIRGELAYIIFSIEVYGLKFDIWFLRAYYKNLEIIVDDQYVLIAYRCDLPSDKKDMDSNDRKWRLYNPNPSSDDDLMHISLN